MWFLETYINKGNTTEWKSIMLEKERNLKSIPLKLLSVFFFEERRNVIKMCQEWLLIWNNDNQVVVSADGAEKAKIEIKKLLGTSLIFQEFRNKYDNKIISKNIELPIKFRSWQLAESSLPALIRHTWPVKTWNKVVNSMFYCHFKMVKQLLLIWPVTSDRTAYCLISHEEGTWKEKSIDLKNRMRRCDYVR